MSRKGPDVVCYFIPQAGHIATLLSPKRLRRQQQLQHQTQQQQNYNQQQHHHHHQQENLRRRQRRYTRKEFVDKIYQHC